jgi:hypothetical protein
MATDARIRELAVAYQKAMSISGVDYYGCYRQLLAALDEPRDPDPAQAKLEALEGKVRAAVVECREKHKEFSDVWPCEDDACCTISGPAARALIAKVKQILDGGTYVLEGLVNDFADDRLRPLTDEEIGVRA